MVWEPKWYCKHRPQKNKHMETYSESKSNYVAFGFTISIHLLLFFIFVFTVFVKPHLLEKTVLTSSDNNMNNDGLFSLETLQMPGENFLSSTNSSSNVITDPKENDVPLNNVKPSTNTEIISDINSTDLQKVLQKIHDQKNKKGENKDSGNLGTSNVGNSTIVEKANEVKIVDSYLQIDRTLISEPGLILNSSEEGKVVVEIIVDENGNVIKATPGQRGSTTVSSSLYKKATQAACQAKFNTSREGIKEQRGTYTFVFTLE